MLCEICREIEISPAGYEISYCYCELCDKRLLCKHCWKLGGYANFIKNNGYWYETHMKNHHTPVDIK